MSNRMTMQQAAIELGISTKTLRRWEESGHFVPEQIPNSSIRLYDSHSVGYLKRLLALDRSIKRHLRLLDGLRKELDKHNLEQDYTPGKPLKLMTDEDMKNFNEAYDAMEEWKKEYRKLLDEIMKYPKSMLKATIGDYDEKGEK